MSRTSLASLVLFLLVLVAAGFWYGTRIPDALSADRGASEGGARPAGSELSRAPAEAAAGGDLAAAPAEERTELAQANAPEADVDLDRMLRGIVVDDVLGAPLAGARVEVLYRLHGEFSNLDLTQNKARRTVETAETGAEGRFAIRVPEDRPLDLEVRARAHATGRRSHLFGGDDVVVRLAPAAILEGVLTRELDGSAIEGALVRGWDKKRVELFRERTGPGGSFYFDDLEAGVITLAITPESVMAPAWKTVELRAGERTREDFVLGDGVMIFGTVTDTEGRAIAGAEIGEGWTFRKSVFTDALGHYELKGFGGPGVYDIHVRADGHGGDQHEYPHDAMPEEDTRLDFVLGSARSAFGRVVNTHVEPIEGVYAAGVASQRFGGDQHTDWESAFTDEHGRFELTSLDVRLGHQLFLRKEGFGTLVYDFPADEAQRERIDLGEIVLWPAGRVRGTLKTPSGAPLPDYEVFLKGNNADMGSLRPKTDATNSTWYTSTRESRTDSFGRFHFNDVALGMYEVYVRVKGEHTDGTKKTVYVNHGKTVDEVELVKDLGLSITGRVVMPGGEPALGVTVMARARDQGRPMAVSTGAGGRFELVGLPEGEVRIETEMHSYNWENPDAPLAPGEPLRAVAGDTDVRITLRELVTLAGRVLDVKGAPVANMQVGAEAAGTALFMDLVVTDTDGRFTMRLPAGSFVDLDTGMFVRGEDADSFVSTGASEPVRLESVASDAQDVVLRLAH